MWLSTCQSTLKRLNGEVNSNPITLSVNSQVIAGSNVKLTMTYSLDGQAPIALPVVTQPQGFTVHILWSNHFTHIDWWLSQHNGFWRPRSKWPKSSPRHDLLHHTGNLSTKMVGESILLSGPTKNDGLKLMGKIEITESH